MDNTRGYQKVISPLPAQQIAEAKCNKQEKTDATRCVHFSVNKQPVRVYRERRFEANINDVSSRERVKRKGPKQWRELACVSKHYFFLLCGGAFSADKVVKSEVAV